MVGHYHALVINFFVNPHRFQHIDVAVVDKRLLKIQKAGMNR
jgi:hypothetical protein